MAQAQAQAQAPALAQGLLVVARRRAATATATRYHHHDDLRRDSTFNDGSHIEAAFSISAGSTDHSRTLAATAAPIPLQTHETPQLTSRRRSRRYLLSFLALRIDRSTAGRFAVLVSRPKRLLMSKRLSVRRAFMWMRLVVVGVVVLGGRVGVGMARGSLDRVCR